MVDLTVEDLQGIIDGLRRDIEEARRNVERLFAVIGAPVGQCRACGEKIWWVKTKHGKPAPFTREGISHFADCPAAHQFRKKEG